jgi:spoIIIJ-associated protein
MFKEFEGKTLEEVYEKASESFNCSVNDLNIDIVQAPSSGFFGFFAKKAIIKAKLRIQTKKYNKHKSTHKDKNRVKKHEVETLTSQLNALNEEDTSEERNNSINHSDAPQVKKEKIFNDFYDAKQEKLHSTPVVKFSSSELIEQISNDVNELFSHLCYEIDPIKVDIIEEQTPTDQLQQTVYIEFSGKDSALLIGKEGYRYKALSYILFNWINEKYDMMLRLEIAEFLSNQEAAIFSYLEPVIETIKTEGFYKTKVLDGILVHIALTKLREEFPNKYVAVKTNQKGEKYILVNEYRN